MKWASRAGSPVILTAPVARASAGADKGDGPIGYDIRDLAVTVGDDVAFCHSPTRMGAEGAFLLWFRSTIGLRRIDGTWRITHEHNSTPFYMDGSGKAALDLRP